MPIEIFKNTKDKTILGFIYVSAGSSWYQSSDDPVELIALKAIKNAKSSWRHLYRWKPESKWYVHFYDITKCENGWCCDDRGMWKILKDGKALSKRKVPYLGCLTYYF